MVRLAASKAREDFADTLNRVAYRKERVLVHRRGKQIAALVPIEDFDLLEALEDKIDVDDARKVLAKSSKRIPYSKVRKALGL